MTNYKKKYKQLKKLLREWTRAEVMARHGRFDNLEYADYYMIKLEKESKIRKKLFKTDNLVDLGLKWGLLKPRKGKERR